MTNSVVIDKPIIDDGLPPDPEALIEEARRRTRRRRAAYAAALGLLILGVLTGVVVTRGGSKKLPTMTPRSPLTVDARAFHAHGVLAFVSKGSLYVLDGASGRLVAPRRCPAHRERPDALARRTLARLPGGRSVTAPISCGSRGRTAPMRIGLRRWETARYWDGARRKKCSRWSACRRRTGPADPSRRRSPWCWSPHRAHCGPSTRWRNSCANPRGFYGAVWSPDGNSLAIATTNFKRSGGSRVFAIDLATGARRTWFAIRTTHHFPGACRSSCISDEVVADLAGWWPQARHRLLGLQQRHVSERRRVAARGRQRARSETDEARNGAL